MVAWLRCSPVLYWINSKNLLQTRCLNKFNYLLDYILYESFVFTILLSDCYITVRNIRKLTICYRFHDWIFLGLEEALRKYMLENELLKLIFLIASLLQKYASINPQNMLPLTTTTSFWPVKKCQVKIFRGIYKKGILYYVTQLYIVLSLPRPPTINRSTLSFLPLVKKTG